MTKILISAVIIAALIYGFVWLCGSSNPSTDAGYMGYVFRTAIFGKSEFLGLQTGPTSYGRTWLCKVVNVSVTPYTFNELFDTDATAVMSKDNNKLKFSAHVVLEIDANGMKEFVEKFTTMNTSDSADKVVQVAYDNFLKEPFRTFVRNQVQKYEAMQVKEKIIDIGKDVDADMRGWCQNTPFKIMMVTVGNLQLPDSVATASANYVASEVELNRLTKVEMLIQAQQIELTKKKAEIRKEEAVGIANAMKEIQSNLTAAYLQYQAIDAQKAMVGSPNHTVIYIPVGPMGIPIIGTLNQPTNPKIEETK